MTRLVLAGDVGGTKTDLALFELEATGLRLEREHTYASGAVRSLEEILADFLKGAKVLAAGFGILGPVIDERVVTTNLPWKEITQASIGAAVGCEARNIALMNDLQTTALGALHLDEDKFAVLNRGVERRGNRAVIAAGTGLGQSFLYWDGRTHKPVATEGGHTDFGPRDETEARLLAFVRKKLGLRVTYERLVSGPGLKNVFDFVDQELKTPVAPAVRDALKSAPDPSAVIGKAGVDGSCAASSKALDLMVSIYGAQAANQALTVMATGGVYVGGGIAVKILPKLTGGLFLRAFTDKNPYEKLLAEIPVRVILEPRASRIGAAVAARRIAEGD